VPGECAQLRGQSGRHTAPAGAIAHRARLRNAGVPKARELPEDIAALTRHNAVEVRSSHFRQDADDLTHKISEILKENGPASRRLVLPIIGVLLALLLGWVGLYQARKGSLPWIHSTTTEQAKSPACKSGFVWRGARADDLVCVTPDSRARVAEENRTASSRIQPGGGPSGPFSCLSGFVWREAFQGDLVCVTPEVRTLVREENQQAASRRVQ
jgi:hypothetical protein